MNQGIYVFAQIVEFLPQRVFDRFVEKYRGNVTYQNFLLDSSFSAIDFYDADHLDEIGAKKLTSKIDSLINLNKQSTLP